MIYLTGDTTFWVAPVSQGAGDGTSEANAMGDEQAAMNYIAANINRNSYTLTMRLSALYGGFTKGIQMSGDIAGGQKTGGSPLVITGDPTNAANVAFITSGNTFSFIDKAIATIVCLTASAMNGSSIFYATEFATIEAGSVRLGSAGKHFDADINGHIIVTGSYEAVQGASIHGHANKGYLGFVPGVSVTLDGGVAFSDTFLKSEGNSVVDCPAHAMGWSGSINGSVVGKALTGGGIRSGFNGGTPWIDYIPGASPHQNVDGTGWFA